MKEFKDFNIKIATNKFKMFKILNKEIIIHDFKIEKSKIYADRGTGNCLHLQLSLDDKKYILFTSGIYLIETIQQIPKEDFPFKTTIIEENQHYVFS